MKVLSKAPEISQRPKKLSELWFQHQSPLALKVIVPQSYSSIKDSRGEDMSSSETSDYVDYRVSTEDAYRSELGIDDDTLSFTYASIVGFNKMEAAEDYPGFTYYFHMSQGQVERALFGIVANEPYGIDPSKGIQELERSLSAWIRNSSEMVSEEDDTVGKIDPRIEVVIPFRVWPTAMVVQQEDRLSAAGTVPAPWIDALRPCVIIESPDLRTVGGVTTIVQFQQLTL